MDDLIGSIILTILKLQLQKYKNANEFIAEQKLLSCVPQTFTNLFKTYLFLKFSYVFNGAGVASCLIKSYLNIVVHNLQFC